MTARGPGGWASGEERMMTVNGFPVAVERVTPDGAAGS